MSEQHEVESNVAGMEPHDVRMARKILERPVDPRCEQSMERLLASAVVRYFEKK